MVEGADRSAGPICSPFRIGSIEADVCLIKDVAAVGPAPGVCVDAGSPRAQAERFGVRQPSLERHAADVRALTKPLGPRGTAAGRPSARVSPDGRRVISPIRGRGRWHLQVVAGPHPIALPVALAGIRSYRPAV